jgi:CRP-like cAMP-binding protein
MASGIWGAEKLDLFKNLNAMEMQEITKISKKVFFKKAEIISDIQMKSRDVYTLIDGRVDIVSLGGISLYRITNNEIFGELAIVPNVKRTAIAIAGEDSWILILNINHLEALREENPEIYRKVYENLVRSLGIKLARANKLIELLKAELSKSLRDRDKD